MRRNVKWFKKNRIIIFKALRQGLKTKKILLMNDLPDILNEHELKVNHTQFMEYIFKRNIGYLVGQKIIPIYAGRLHDKRALANLDIVKEIIKDNKNEILEQIKKTKAAGYCTTYTAEEEISILIPDTYVRVLLKR